MLKASRCVSVRPSVSLASASPLACTYMRQAMHVNSSQGLGFACRPAWSSGLDFARQFSSTAAKTRNHTNPIVLQLKDVTKKLDGGRCLLESVRLAIRDGDRVGFLGVNGAGKSSVMKIMSGLDKSFTGEVWRDENLRIGYLHQEPELDETKDVIGNVLDGVMEKMEWLQKFEELSAAMCEPDADFDTLLVEQADLQSKIDLHDAWDIETQAKTIMEALRCPEPKSSVHNLSGGERRRVALCRLLIENPHVLLLDEPTNHLDAKSISWLQKYLKQYKGTVVLVTHDRYFLDHITEWILEVDRGTLHPFEGNYTNWLEHKQARLTTEREQAAKQKKLMQKELEWIRSSAQHRRKVTKARIKRAATTEFSGSHISTGHLMIPAGPRLGDTVVCMDKVTKSYDGRTLFKGLSFQLQKGWTVGVVGANGVGKSTLIKLMMGYEKPDAGLITKGSSVSMGHLSQNRTSLNDDNTVYSEVSNGQEMIQVGDTLMNARTYVAQFNFSGRVQEKKIGMLSGGERNRVHLAKSLQKGYNVLLMDEPTNDLDVDTLRALEEALPDFHGCSVVVSHDRWFLNRICTHIIAFEGPSSPPVFFNGNYDEYEQFKLSKSSTSTSEPDASDLRMTA